MRTVGVASVGIRVGGGSGWGGRGNGAKTHQTNEEFNHPKTLLIAVPKYSLLLEGQPVNLNSSKAGTGFGAEESLKWLGRGRGACSA